MDAPTGPIVTLTGELDIYRATAIHETLASVPPNAIIDLSAVTYLDSTLLNELARVRKRVGTDLVLVVGSQQVRRILEVAGFARLFRIVDVGAVH